MLAISQEQYPPRTRGRDTSYIDVPPPLPAGGGYAPPEAAVAAVAERHGYRINCAAIAASVDGKPFLDRHHDFNIRCVRRLTRIAQSLNFPELLGLLLGAESAAQGSRSREGVSPPPKAPERRILLSEIGSEQAQTQEDRRINR